VPTRVKEQACTALGKRNREAASTSTVEYNGERIDKAKLRRYMISIARQDNALQLGNNMLVPPEPRFPVGLIEKLASYIGICHTKLSRPRR
jgi:hypothetical protein